MSNAVCELRVSENLLILERDPDQLLLVNGLCLKPMYIKQGAGYVKQFIEAVRQLGDADKIAQAFPQDNELLGMLVEHRIVIPDGEPESPDERKPCQHSEAGEVLQSGSGISLYLLLSQSCNLGCVYCLNGTRTYQKEANPRMSEEVAFASVVRCMERLQPKGKLEIVFFGGEPLLNWPLAKKIITYCEDELKPKYSDRYITYHLTSNLTLMPDDLIEWAQKYHITFLCDVDGPSAIHDECRPCKNGRASSFELTANNVRLLTEAGLKVGLRTTVTSINQDHMAEIAALHKTMGGAGSAFVPVNPVNSDEDVLSNHLLPSVEKTVEGLAKAYETKVWTLDDLFPFNVYAYNLKMGLRNVRGCGAPYGNIVVVDAGGNAYPCIYLVGMKRFYLGNILDESYPDVAVLNGMMTELDVDNMEECKSCNWRYMCGGGCAVGKLTVLNNPAASDEAIEYCNGIRCDYTKKTIELLLWELAEEAAGSAAETVPAENVAS